MHAPAGRGFQGSVLFTRSDVEDKSKCLVIGIGGDTLMSIVAHLTGRQSERPMSLNLMWNIIQKGENSLVETADLKALTLVDLWLFCNNVQRKSSTESRGICRGWR